jgi:hypothetical protein
MPPQLQLMVRFALLDSERSDPRLFLVKFISESGARNDAQHFDISGFHIAQMDEFVDQLVAMLATNSAHNSTETGDASWPR